MLWRSERTTTRSSTAMPAASTHAHSKSKPVVGSEVAPPVGELLLLPLLAGTNVAVAVAAPTTTVTTGMVVAVGVCVGVAVGGVTVAVGVDDGVKVLVAAPAATVRVGVGVLVRVA